MEDQSVADQFGKVYLDDKTDQKLMCSFEATRVSKSTPTFLIK